MELVIQTSMFQAFVDSGFFKGRDFSDKEYVDYLANSLESIQGYTATPEDIRLFNTFNPASDKSMRDSIPEDAKISLIELQTWGLFNLGFNYEMKLPGIFCAAGCSYLTLESFNALYLRAKKLNLPVSISFTWKNPIVMSKRLSLNILES